MIRFVRAERGRSVLEAVAIDEFRPYRATGVRTGFEKLDIVAGTVQTPCACEARKPSAYDDDGRHQRTPLTPLSP